MKRQLVLEELADAYNYKTNCKNIFFACAIVSIFLIYVCIWAPIIVYVRKKVWPLGYHMCMHRSRLRAAYSGWFRMRS